MDHRKIDDQLHNQEEQDDDGGGRGSNIFTAESIARKSGGSAVLSRGWTIGKNAVIAGAAVTSVPVVIPPLLVALAVGIAFAVPFGVLFTSVACTDRVMRSLLSPPPGPQSAAQNPEGDEDDDVSVEMEREEASNLSSCYESALEDLSSDVENKGVTVPLAGNDDEILHGEGKIWEQISAIQTIVGQKPGLHSSYVEELKALYVFTGVEPPLSVKGPSDITEINQKLKCLKTVLGIK